MKNMNLSQVDLRASLGLIHREHALKVWPWKNEERLKDLWIQAEVASQVPTQIAD